MKKTIKRKKYNTRKLLKELNELCILPSPIEHKNYIRYIGIVSAEKLYK